MTDAIRQRAAGPWSRRTFLQVSAAGVVSATALGGASRMAHAARGPFTWISPRGTLEVLDDYPYWVAREFGYFGDIETVMEPGPSDGTATVKFVDQGQADMGFPSPGVFSFAIENGLDLVSVFNMGAVDVFDFAFRPGEGMADLKGLEGKTVLLGSAAWQSIADPILYAVGVDVSKVTYVEAGWPAWGTLLARGEGDAALAWEGLRADWQGKGLQFDYWLGLESSPFPANSFVVRQSDMEDPDQRQLIEDYLRGWAMGLEFGHQNPAAATDIVFKQFPIVKSSLGPRFGIESMMQLANVFRGNFEEREGWGWHDPARWTAFFDATHALGQTTVDVDIDRVVNNDLIAGANTFDADKVAADAAGYQLTEDMAEVDMDLIRAQFFANAVNI
ncbi:MAG: ABC transporter substrate-binding protein [Alphaproteobacteria bacterium]